MALLQYDEEFDWPKTGANKQTHESIILQILILTGMGPSVVRAEEFWLMPGDDPVGEA